MHNGAKLFFEVASYFFIIIVPFNLCLLGQKFWNDSKIIGSMYTWSLACTFLVSELSARTKSALVKSFVTKD